jgi:catechol 2,3-dioxygenase-like lactoylglutathione lyase family enzyme
MAAPVLRVARPTDDIDALMPFYRDGLGFEVLDRFEDHAGFDGVTLGHRRAPWHLEFTRAHGQAAGRAPTRENLLVLYLPVTAAWVAAVGRMQSAGFEPVASANPYWERDGRTFEDPDGYRLVLQRGEWR